MVVFDAAPDMNAWLAEHLSEVALMSLDHDLGYSRRRGDEVFEPGTGLDAAPTRDRYRSVLSTLRLQVV